MTAVLTDDCGPSRPCPVDGCSYGLRDAENAAVTDAELRAHLRDRHTIQEFIATVSRLKAELDATRKLLEEVAFGRVGRALGKALHG